MMNEYPICETALYTDPELAAYIGLALDKKNGSIPEEIQKFLDEGRFAQLARENSEILQDYYPADDFEIGVWHGDVSGSISSALPEKCMNTVFNKEISCDTIRYIPIDREVSLFHATYESSYELLAEFKGKVEDFCKGFLELPDDFDWFARIVEICAVYVA